MANFHNIQAQLYDNILTPNPNDFIARVSSERTLTVKDVCVSAVARGGAKITAEDMEHAVNIFHREMGYNLCDRFSINTGWYTASVSIKGVFDSPTEKFNPGKHTVMFDFKQGTLLRKELGNVTVEITGVAVTAGFIGQVTDVKTGSINDLLTPGRNLRISGVKIKIDGDDPANGVFFINQDTQERCAVDPSDIVNNNPSEVMIIIPELTAGAYRIEIVTQYSSGKNLKHPRTTAFERILTVG